MAEETAVAEGLTNRSCISCLSYLSLSKSVFGFCEFLSLSPQHESRIAQAHHWDDLMKNPWAPNVGRYCLPTFSDQIGFFAVGWLSQDATNPTLLPSPARAPPGKSSTVRAPTLSHPPSSFRQAAPHQSQTKTRGSHSGPSHTLLCRIAPGLASLFESVFFTHQRIQEKKTKQNRARIPRQSPEVDRGKGLLKESFQKPRLHSPFSPCPFVSEPLRSFAEALGKHTVRFRPITRKAQG